MHYVPGKEFDVDIQWILKHLRLFYCVCVCAYVCVFVCMRVCVCVLSFVANTEINLFQTFSQSICIYYVVVLLCNSMCLYYAMATDVPVSKLWNSGNFDILSSTLLTKIHTRLCDLSNSWPVLKPWHLLHMLFQHPYKLEIKKIFWGLLLTRFYKVSKHLWYFTSLCDSQLM